MYALDQETIWAPIQDWRDRDGGDPEADERRYGARAVGPEGPRGGTVWVPEIPLEQTTYEIRKGSEQPTPYSPWLIWNPTPAGGIVAGASDRYRFEVRGADGATTVIERSWQPVPLPVEHREWARRRTVARNRSVISAWDWDGGEIPTHKPAFSALASSTSGETWVIRAGPSKRMTACAEDPIATGPRAAFVDPCWVDELTADVFGADGRLLGSVRMPEELWGSAPWGAAATMLHVAGERVVAVAQDARGTFMVKRYRLELPSGGRN